MTPSWPIPKNIHAVNTVRYPGNSVAPYAEFNLALHVGDNAHHVLENRKRLVEQAHLPSSPKWLKQTHSAIALLAETVSSDLPPEADASYTQKSGEVCVVMTADCLPILVANKSGTEVAAIHAGWQGLAAGIVENTIKKLSSKPNELLIWIGPSIHQENYEVGEDVYKKFSETHSSAEMNVAFQPHGDKWLANVPLLAEQRLMRLGINQHDIYASDECTYAHPEKYFSYRREGITGRMASLIWIT